MSKALLFWGLKVFISLKYNNIELGEEGVLEKFADQIDWYDTNVKFFDISQPLYGASINYVDKQGEGGGRPNVNDTT